jgi:LacI family transcriptional regulator
MPNSGYQWQSAAARGISCAISFSHARRLFAALVSMSKQLLHVALLIETSREYARGLLRGVARYLQEHTRWSVYFEPHGLDSPPPKWLPSWQGDGMLVRINNRQMADAILNTGIPAVDLRGVIPDLGIPFIGVDNAPVSRMGFEHLHSCGLRHFAFCGSPRGEVPNQDLRCDYFVAAAREAGHQCSVHIGGLGPRGAEPTWEQQQQALVEWLQGLPLPVGVMCCHDDRGQQVLDACRRAGLAVPDQVAVLGVDNDPNLCNLCNPPLSSIDVNPARIGYEAAVLLERLMAGAKAPTEPCLLGPPRGIAARHSTDLLWVEDEEVAASIRFIREHACEGITVRDVLNQSTNSPSALEKRVKKTLGRTIKAEIGRIRLARAKLLLAETNWPVAKIAERCGFGEPKYFSAVFHKTIGIKAMDYRRRFREDA